MNREGQGYQRYKGRKQWQDDTSSGSPYDGARMSPYRGESRGPHHNAPPSNGYSSDPGSVGSVDDGPTYVLEHLATFRVSPEAGLLYPSDGMRRLLHMEKTTGIWTQKMMMKLDLKWVFILSHENGDVVEKFPMELIREPTAFTSEDPKELYNNIFIFVVAEDPKRKYDNPTEMHIFQCMRISAKDVVEDMKLYMSGKTLSPGAGRGVRGEHIPPPPQEPAPEPPLLPNGYRDYSDAEVRDVVRGPRSERSSVSHNDEVSSTSSERYERDVAILNNCFDDIERFIARLQHTAAATRELERRRRSRKSKKKDIGDGLLSMRAKPPPEAEFIDIFQKFKLSFNLLAKLRAHIRDPNAPELVHFLFTPLALIVDASRESYFDSSLPPKVVSPLLTHDAIELLTNCLSSRETELWQSLGAAWLIPKEEWKYQVPPYRPVFYSGWAPEIADETPDRKYMLYHDKGEGDIRKGMHDDFEFYDSDKKDTSPPPPSDLAHAHAHAHSHARYRGGPQRIDRPGSMTPLSEFHDDPQSFEKSQRKYFEELKARGAKIVQVTYPRTANNDKELTVVRGEYLEVVDDSKKWWKARNSRGVTAHVPHTIVTPYFPDEDHLDVHSAAPPSRNKKDHYGYPDSSDDETYSQQRKPKTPIPAPPPPPPAEYLASKEREREKKQMPLSSQAIFGTTKSHTDLMNEELKLVLEDFRKTRPHLDIVKTPDVYINQKSTPEEVQKWLKLKGFNERICKQFDGVDGEKMFLLSRNQLEEYCGRSEGSRMASQITIQRSVSGYKTVRSTELKNVLEEQRKKIDAKSGVVKSAEKSKIGVNKSYSSDEDVSNNFQFLQNYDTEEPKDGYASEDESGPEEEVVVRPSKVIKSPVPKNTKSPVPKNTKSSVPKSAKSSIPKSSSSSDGGNNTLKDQIKNQHKRIVKEPAQVIASR